MKKSKIGEVIGWIIIIVGIATLMFTYRLVAVSEFGFCWALLLLLIMVYAMLSFNKNWLGNNSTADDIDFRYRNQPISKHNTHTGNIPAPASDDVVNVPKRIEITINDNGIIALSTCGMNPQEIIASLELTKHYIISKHIMCGSPMGIVRRK